jgi:thiamine-phosphate pyrophosphorylase
MQRSYDREADAVAISFDGVKWERTIDITGDIFVDVDRDGRLAGIEILHASEKLELSDLTDMSTELPIHSVAINRLVSDFHLYVLTDHILSRGRLNVEVIKAAIAGGADAIQLRDKGFTAKRLIQEALILRDITREGGVPFIVNDRVDVALAADADGVHLGQGDLPISWARRLLGKHKIIGVSTHSVEEAVQAEKDGADYISIGSVFPTTTKSDARPLAGLELITDIKRNVNIPVVAIGGIKEENVAQVGEAGADCIAVISAVVSATDIKQAAKNLREKFLAARRKQEVNTGDAVRSSSFGRSDT